MMSMIQFEIIESVVVEDITETGAISGKEHGKDGGRQMGTFQLTS